MATDTKILERVKVREVASVFRSRDVLDTAVSALLSSGFDRADIDIMVGADSTRKTWRRKDRRGGVAGGAGGSSAARHCPRGHRPSLVARTVDRDLRRRRICAWLVVKSGEELIWAGVSAAVVGACCRVARSTAGSRLCTQAYQAPRSAVDHPRARLAGPRSLGRRRGKGDANTSWPWRASGAPA